MAWTATNHRTSQDPFAPQVEVPWDKIFELVCLLTPLTKINMRFFVKNSFNFYYSISDIFLTQSLILLWLIIAILIGSFWSFCIGNNPSRGRMCLQIC